MMAITTFDSEEEMEYHLEYLEELRWQISMKKDEIEGYHKDIEDAEQELLELEEEYRENEQ